jgi:DNA (cytosine-5)-methyltransferase 1
VRATCVCERYHARASTHGSREVDFLSRSNGSMRQWLRRAAQFVTRICIKMTNDKVDIFRPKLLDLFCGAGGAAMGYYRAGFDVVGVDIKPQPHYPFEFHQGDALEFCAEHGREFDVIHASPPCQAYSMWQNVNRARGSQPKEHAKLIPQTRQALIATGRVYVIENVQCAPLQTQIILCGMSFGLPHLARHRHFESNFLFTNVPPCTHRSATYTVGVYGKQPDGHRVSHKQWRMSRTASSIKEARIVMGIDWMDWNEIKEAVPPAYTEFIGCQLIAALQGMRDGS